MRGVNGGTGRRAGPAAAAGFGNVAGGRALAVGSAARAGESEAGCVSDGRDSEAGGRATSVTTTGVGGSTDVLRLPGSARSSMK